MFRLDNKNKIFMEGLLCSRDYVRHFACSNSLKFHVDCNDSLIKVKENWIWEKLSNLSRITPRSWATWLRTGRFKSLCAFKRSSLWLSFPQKEMHGDRMLELYLIQENSEKEILSRQLWNKIPSGYESQKNFLNSDWSYFEHKNSRPWISI